jgi:molybdenum storage protein
LTRKPSLERVDAHVGKEVRAGQELETGDWAEVLPRVSAAELLAMDVETLPIDPIVRDLMATAKHVKEIQIINGLTPGNITKALAGEHVGTIIDAG